MTDLKQLGLLQIIIATASDDVKSVFEEPKIEEDVEDVFWDQIWENRSSDKLCDFEWNLKSSLPEDH